jgi:hypothetical protein
MSKEERMYLILKGMANNEIRSFADLAEEIWVSQPTLRDFFKWEYTKKTFKLVDAWFKSHARYLSDVYTKYWDIEHDNE